MWFRSCRNHLQVLFAVGKLELEYLLYVHKFYTAGVGAGGGGIERGGRGREKGGCGNCGGGGQARGFWKWGVLCLLWLRSFEWGQVEFAQLCSWELWCWWGGVTDTRGVVERKGKRKIVDV